MLGENSCQGGLEGLRLRSCRDAGVRPGELIKTAAFYRSEPPGKCSQNPRGAGSKAEQAGSRPDACRVSFTQESPEPVQAGAG